jgi:hypothetical protein
MGETEDILPRGESRRPNALGAALEGDKRLAEAFAHQLLDFPPAGFGVRAGRPFGAVEAAHDEIA